MKNGKTTEVNLNENKIYVVKDEKLIPINAPDGGYGEQKVTWQNGKVTYVDTQSRKKLD